MAVLPGPASIHAANPYWQPAHRAAAGLLEAIQQSERRSGMVGRGGLAPMATATPTDLTDAQWTILAPLLPPRNRRGAPRVDDQSDSRGTPCRGSGGCGPSPPAPRRARGC